MQMDISTEALSIIHFHKFGIKKNLLIWWTISLMKSLQRMIFQIAMMRIMTGFPNHLQALYGVEKGSQNIRINDLH